MSCQQVSLSNSVGYLEGTEAPKDKAAYQQNPMTHYQLTAEKYSDILI